MLLLGLKTRSHLVDYMTYQLARYKHFVAPIWEWGGSWISNAMLVKHWEPCLMVCHVTNGADLILKR